MNYQRPLALFTGWTATVLLLGGCAFAPPAPPDLATSPWALQSGGSPAHRWARQGIPGKAETRFTYERNEGRDALAVQADASASMLRQVLRIEPSDLGLLRFSWKVPELIPGADLALRERADAPVRIVLAFDGDRSRLSARDAALSELVRALTGEPMPYATMMYVWSGRREPDAVIRNPRTDRIRKLVVESGPRRLDQWVDYQRDIRTDFVRTFGEQPGALIGIAVMTDTDNTQSSVRAWYGPVQLVPRPAAP